MRSVVAALGLFALAGVMLLPTTIAAEASPSESVAASESAEPSAPVLPDAFVDLGWMSETEPGRTWAISVTGGTPSVDGVTVDQFASFTVAVLGESATVEMTVTLPPGWALTFGDCFDQTNQVDHLGTLIPPRTLALEVVQGGFYSCTYGSSPVNVPTPTVPTTDSRPSVEPSSPRAGSILLAATAAVIVATLVAIRTRPAALGVGTAVKRRRHR